MRINLFPMLLVAVLLCAPAVAAPALQIGPTGSEMMTQMGTPAAGVTDSTSMNPDGTMQWTGSWMTAQWNATWDLTLDADPGIFGVIGLTNNGAGNMMMTYNVAMPVVGTYPTGSFMTGSSSITVADSNFDGSAMMSDQFDGSIYTGLLDGAAELSLFLRSVPATPTSLNVMTLGGSTSANDSFTGVTSQGLSSTMGINHMFMLSGGDSATVNSTFYVVPEPMTLSLLGLGGLALLRRRR